MRIKKIDKIIIAATLILLVYGVQMVYGDLTGTEGLAIDMSSAGAGTDFTVAFDPTELVGNRTWGDASTDTMVWTWNRATGTDPTMTFNDGSIALPALTLTTDLVVAEGGTGVSSFTDGFVLLGSGAGAITALDTTADGAIMIGDGTTDPVALDVGSSTAITILGTVGTGVWQGTAVADTYVADDITLTNISQITTKPITSLSATNWRIFYSGAGSIPIELALGADGTFLESNGAAAAPAFRVLAAGDIPDISATYQPLHASLTSISGLTEAAGVLIYGTADDAYAALAAGATTTILVGGGAAAPVWTTATGTGAPVRATSATLVTPALGTPSALVGTNITGTASSLTAGNVTTNANLTGEVTSAGNAAVIVESFLEDGGASEIAVTAGMMNTGTNADATTYWRGDNTWVTPGGSGDMTKAVYDVSDDGFVDGNDVAYGAAWNADVNAPSMNAVYDKIEILVKASDFTQNSGVLVGTGAGTYAEETGTTLRTSIGVGTGDSPQFTGIELGHASDTTITRASAGDLNIEGNIAYRAGGTDVPVTDGGTGRSTSTTAYALLAAGTTATGAHQTLASGATTEILVGGGAAALPVWTTATGTGAPVRETSATLVTPALGTPTALVGTNITGTGASFTAGTATLATTVTVADESADATSFLLFATAATGSLGAKTGAGLTVDASTDTLGATILKTANNIKDEPKHLRFTITNPLATQTEDNEVIIVVSIDAAITITNLEVTLDAAGNEVAGDIKWADAFIGLANATVINDFDTTSGVRSDSSITAGSVAAGKVIYASFDSAPDTAITQMGVDLTYDYD